VAKNTDNEYWTKERQREWLARHEAELPQDYDGDHLGRDGISYYGDMEWAEKKALTKIENGTEVAASLGDMIRWRAEREAVYEEERKALDEMLPKAGLTEKQAKVIELVRANYGVSEIAQMLGIAYPAVIHHRDLAIKKLRKCL